MRVLGAIWVIDDFRVATMRRGHPLPTYPSLLLRLLACASLSLPPDHITWSVTSPSRWRHRGASKAQIPLWRLPRNLTVGGKFRESRRNGIWAKGNVTGLSRTCRRRHGEVGIVEFGLKHVTAVAAAICRVLRRPSRRCSLLPTGVARWGLRGGRCGLRAEQDGRQRRRDGRTATAAAAVRTSYARTPWRRPRRAGN